MLKRKCKMIFFYLFAFTIIAFALLYLSLIDESTKWKIPKRVNGN